MNSPATNTPAYEYSDVRLSSSSKRSTQVDDSRDKDWRSERARSTVISAVQSTRIVSREQFPAEPVVPQQPPAALGKVVTGNIVDAEGAVFICEMLAGNREVEVALARELFDWEAKPGDAFSLRMEERGGVRQPIVTRRTPDLTVGAEIRAEIDRLVRSIR